MAKINKEDNQAVASKNKLLWLLFSFFLVAGIGLNYYFGSVSWAIRAAAGIVLALVLLVVAFATTQGKLALGFCQSARYELTRVHWPKREETIQIALRVIMMIAAATVLLWVLDNLFVWGMSWLSKQGGL